MNIPPVFRLFLTTLFALWVESVFSEFVSIPKLGCFWPLVSALCTRFHNLKYNSELHLTQVA